MRDLTDGIKTTARNFVQGVQQYFASPWTRESLEKTGGMLDGLIDRPGGLKEEVFFDL